MRQPTESPGIERLRDEDEKRPAGTVLGIEPTHGRPPRLGHRRTRFKSVTAAARCVNDRERKANDRTGAARYLTQALAVLLELLAEGPWPAAAPPELLPLATYFVPRLSELAAGSPSGARRLGERGYRVTEERDPDADPVIWRCGWNDAEIIVTVSRLELSELPECSSSEPLRREMIARKLTTTEVQTCEYIDRRDDGSWEIVLEQRFGADSVRGAAFVEKHARPPLLPSSAAGLAHDRELADLRSRLDRAAVDAELQAKPAPGK
jgi:hypothetical protein